MIELEQCGRCEVIRFALELFVNLWLQRELVIAVAFAEVALPGQNAVSDLVQFDEILPVGRNCLIKVDLPMAKIDQSEHFFQSAGKKAELAGQKAFVGFAEIDVALNRQFAETGDLINWRRKTSPSLGFAEEIANDVFDRSGRIQDGRPHLFLLLDLR